MKAFLPYWAFSAPIFKRLMVEHCLSLSVGTLSTSITANSKSHLVLKIAGGWVDWICVVGVLKILLSRYIKGGKKSSMQCTCWICHHLLAKMLKSHTLVQPAEENLISFPAGYKTTSYNKGKLRTKTHMDWTGREGNLNCPSLWGFISVLSNGGEKDLNKSLPERKACCCCHWERKKKGGGGEKLHEDNINSYSKSTELRCSFPSMNNLANRDDFQAKEWKYRISFLEV